MTRVTRPTHRYPRTLLLTFAAGLALTVLGMTGGVLVPLLTTWTESAVPMTGAAAGFLTMGVALERARVIRDGRVGMRATFDEKVGSAHLTASAVLLACLVLEIALPDHVGWSLLSVMTVAAVVTVGSTLYLSVRESRGAS